MTTITIDITGYEDTLANAVAIHNKHHATIEPGYKDLTQEEYLQKLVERQLEGLTVATTRILSDEEARKAREREGQARMDQVRRAMLRNSSVG